MREGKFNISYEKKEGKTIIHCYGHGGSGWTTLFGSVNKAIGLFIEHQSDKRIPIRIIGSGCMGLTAAIELDRLGYRVAGITTKSLHGIPSWQAAGYFALVSVKTSPEEQENLNSIGLDTFLTFEKIEKGLHPYITREAVKYMPVYCSQGTEAGVEELEKRGVIPPREYVTLDFGNGVTHEGYIKYLTYFMDTTSLMRQLAAEVNTRNIPVQIEMVKSFKDLSEEIIFNCSGLGSRELNEDTDLIGVRGHLVTLKEAAGNKHMEYMIYTNVDQEGREEYVYMFPKNVSVTVNNTEGAPCAAVLGGTFIPHADRLSNEEQAMLDQVEIKRLLDRNSLFFQGHLFSE
jgi:hypothetical protein